MIPDIRISTYSWKPGTAHYMPVMIEEVVSGGIKPFLSEVPLATAKTIVACFQFCRGSLNELKAMENDR